MPETYLTVGQLAKKMNVTVRTLQYYDNIGLVKPSAYSDGGRRLYTDQDAIELHQVLALKYLGFSLEKIKEVQVSLDTPEEVASILQRQSQAIGKQIHKLKRARQDLEALREEVMKMREVDFAKYADIVAALKGGNEHYWIWKQLDHGLAQHVRDKFSGSSAEAAEIINTYNDLLDRALLLLTKDEKPSSKASQELAEDWWKMVMQFTDGDLSLLPKLMEFNLEKKNWNKETAQKQKKVDPFLEKILAHYFQHGGML